MNTFIIRVKRFARKQRISCRRRRGGSPEGAKLTASGGLAPPRRHGAGQAKKNRPFFCPPAFLADAWTCRPRQDRAGCGGRLLRPYSGSGSAAPTMYRRCARAAHAPPGAARRRQDRPRTAPDPREHEPGLNKKRKNARIKCDGKLA